VMNNWPKKEDFTTKEQEDNDEDKQKQHND
jgi:hypothetical protein